MPDSPNKLFQFWQELKRRKVVRVITIYAAAAFVILQLVEILAPSLRLPEWTMNFILVLLIVGFIIAVILSWIYDINPEVGLEKTKPVISKKKEEITTTSTGWKIATYISILIILSFVALFITNGVRRSSDMSKLEKSIAVLPFENWNYDEEYSHLGDAMADEIILQLQYIDQFDRILSRTSTIQYKNSEKSIPVIAEELGVNYIITGSIQPQKEEVSIRVQVIRGIEEDHIWGDEFNGRWEDIFKIQDDIAIKVAKELKTVLSPKELERIEKKPTEIIKAYDLYLLGKNYLNKRTAEDLELSIQYFMEAIILDESYARAYTGLADAYIIGADWNFLIPETAYQRAHELAQKAIKLDDQIAESYTTLAAVIDILEFDYNKVESLYLSAIRLNPNHAGGYYGYALFLTRLRRYEEAISNMNRAIELDPLSPAIIYNSGFIYYLSGDCDKSLSQLRETLKIDSLFKPVSFQMFLCQFQKGNITEAISHYNKLVVNEPACIDFTKKANVIYIESGKDELLKYIIESELKSSDPSTRILAILYSLSGDKEKALSAGCIDYISK